MAVSYTHLDVYKRQLADQRNNFIQALTLLETLTDRGMTLKVWRNDKQVCYSSIDNFISKAVQVCNEWVLVSQKGISITKRI